jgi:hypothetical protein
VGEFIFGVRPEVGNAEVRARAAVSWLLRAQETSGTGGVALGYFPCSDGRVWYAAYPETTGYIITSLLRFASRHNDTMLRRRALDMARWEIEIQLPSGATQGGSFDPSVQPTPCAFNTGMVLDGLCSAFDTTKDDGFLLAARRSANYLICDMTDEGYFKTNGQFVTPGLIKTYNCLCAWAIYRFAVLAEDAAYKWHAIRAVEAALRQQQSNGWFANNCLTRSNAPLLHTIGYTLQGILEVGILAEREDFIRAASVGVAPLLPKIERSGILPGRYFSDWEPASVSSCLTGSAQLAVICYRLYQHTGQSVYRESADRLVNFLKPLQRMKTGCSDIDGALPGSFPIFGEYMTAGYPNWATKYLLDALMFQEAIETGQNARPDHELENYGVR